MPSDFRKAASNDLRRAFDAKTDSNSVGHTEMTAATDYIRAMQMETAARIAESFKGVGTVSRPRFDEVEWHDWMEGERASRDSNP